MALKLRHAGQQQHRDRPAFTLSNTPSNMARIRTCTAAQHTPQCRNGQAPAERSQRHHKHYALFSCKGQCASSGSSGTAHSPTAESNAVMT
ncbi:hypothetical protein ACU4HD_44160 [Cupriavidus basilensis]